MTNAQSTAFKRMQADRWSTADSLLTNETAMNGLAKLGKVKRKRNPNYESGGGFTMNRRWLYKPL